MVHTRANPAPEMARSNGQTSGQAARNPTARQPWSHAPSQVFLLWLCISLPLVMWDFGYVFLRPHSMPGGKWHLPWTPYSIYCNVDLVYGFQHYYDGDGFNPAQSTLNVLETLTYLYYAWLVWSYGVGEKRVLEGRVGALAVVLGMSACTATFWKTCLYWLQEILGQYRNIGHNSAWTLFWAWLVPNGLWLVFPAIAFYGFANEIIDGLGGKVEESGDNRVAIKDE